MKSSVPTSSLRALKKKVWLSRLQLMAEGKEDAVRPPDEEQAGLVPALVPLVTKSCEEELAEAAKMHWVALIGVR